MTVQIGSGLNKQAMTSENVIDVKSALKTPQKIQIQYLLIYTYRRLLKVPNRAETRVSKLCCRKKMTKYAIINATYAIIY